MSLIRTREKPGEKNGNPCLKMHFSERDIVFYKDVISIDKFLNVNEGIVAEGIGKDEKKAGHIPVPLLIIEIKFRPGATDAIYRESFTMIEIKKIFPQCKSMLLLFERQCTEETLHRNGFAFDEMICLGESNPKNGSAAGVDVSPENLLRLPIFDDRFSIEK